MTIQYPEALALDIPARVQTYSEKDTILYALGVGFGENPLDAHELRYVYERDLLAFPTMAVVLAFTSMRDIDLGIDYGQMVHGEQSLVLHAPLPAAGTVSAKTRVTEIIDRGEKGALVMLERNITAAATGELLATVGMSVLCRADGGFGGTVTSAPMPHPIPERDADFSVDIRTLPQQALIYRLSGDVNPLHVEPAAASKAGFERPILHGLATFGIVGRALVQSLPTQDSTLLRALSGRFSAPVFPRETIRVEIWNDGDNAFSLRAIAVERGKIVFNNGRAAVAG